ncbi:putative ATP-dependent RNA helicase DHX57 [Porphyridium purpureum]|uniref:Putative ATP-dependent RNA helicase DHX57 n=1 Tax=Porphyridium purpureum TaxID=35688 RepID=A0A5J4Z0L4_PORPP|nr:putative ATP-dependent RNA helicase DHX57 [Porphyridium purpureum]|eukprot:POR8472..scf208_2
MGRRGRTGSGGAVVSSLSGKSGNVLKSGKDAADSSASGSASGQAAVTSAGWVGKTPLELLKDACTKQDRKRPVVKPATREGDAEGMYKVHIPPGKRTVKKASDTTDPPGFTVVGSKPGEQWAALAALHFLEHGKALHLLIAPEYRDEWKRLDALMEHKNAAKQAHDQKQAAREQSAKKTAVLRAKNTNVELSTQSRQIIEDALASVRIDSEPRVVSDASTDAVSSVVKRLSKAGFDRMDAELGVFHANSVEYERVLDWLLLNLNEEQLPSAFAPKADVQVVAFRSGEASSSVALNTAISTLRDTFCISMAAAQKAMLQNQKNAHAAAASCFRSLAGLPASKSAPDGDFRSSAQELAELKDQEAEALEAIYGAHDGSGPADFVVEAGMNCGLLAGQWGCRVKFRKLPFLKKSASGVTLIVHDHDGRYPESMPVCVLTECPDADQALRRMVLRAMAAEMVSHRAVNFKTTGHSGKIECDDGEAAPVVHLLVSMLQSARIQDLEERSHSLLAQYFAHLSDDAGSTDNETQATVTPANSSLSRKTITKKAAALQKDHGRASASRVPRTCAPPEMIERRKVLPAWAAQARVLEAFQESRVVLVCGATGSGKTTQVPQFILDHLLDAQQTTDHAIQIVCTQPRRLAAISVAERVAAERGEAVGRSVGYQVKMDVKRSRATMLTFCTTGVILRRLYLEPELDSVSVLILDEVHERAVDSDILLLLLKHILAKNKHIKIVLMSATVNADKFASYFASTSPQGMAGSARIPVVTIEGRTFPVKEVYLEDVVQATEYKLAPGDRYTIKASKSSAQDQESSTLTLIDEFCVNVDLIERVVLFIDRTHSEHREQAILVFFPGVSDIAVASARLAQYSALFVVELHASLSAEKQALCFSRPPLHRRKVVLATNVAETSITIDDIVFVIDTLRVKEQHGVNGMNILAETSISRASAQQRAGRAGRVQPGTVYRLVKRNTFQSVLRREQVPEIKRINLEHVVLTALAVSSVGPDVSAFLQQAIDPPEQQAVENAIATLCAIGAIVNKEEEGKSVGWSLTSLGVHLASLPVDARLGKLIIFGALFSALDPCLTIAAYLSEKPPFAISFENRDEAKAAKQKYAWANSDTLTFVRIFEDWCVNGKTLPISKQFKWCEARFVSRRGLLTIEDTRLQLKKVLGDAGFIPQALNDESVLNSNSQSSSLVSSLLCAALYPNVVRAEQPKKFEKTAHGTVEKRGTDARMVKFRDAHGKRVFIHPECVAFSSATFASDWLVFHEKFVGGVKLRTPGQALSSSDSAKTYIRQLCVVPPMAVLLFGGSIDVRAERDLLVMDGWMYFNGNARIASLIREFRAKLDLMLRAQIETPGQVAETQLHVAVMKLLSSNTA